jgi:phage shock protein A
MTTKRPKTPLGNFPAGAKPKTVADLKRNLKEARERLENCLAEKATHWKYVHENSETGFLVNIRWHLAESEKWGAWAVKIETQIEQWNRQLGELEKNPEPAMTAAVKELAAAYLGDIHGHEQQRQG